MPIILPSRSRSRKSKLIFPILPAPKADNHSVIIVNLNHTVKMALIGERRIKKNNIIVNMGCRTPI